MGKLGFFAGMVRANGGLLGDVDAYVLGLKGGRAPLNFVNNELVAWAVKSEDFVLSKNNVKEVRLIQSDVKISDLSSGGGKLYVVNVYEVKLDDDHVVKMRLLTASADKALAKLR